MRRHGNMEVFFSNGKVKLYANSLASVIIRVRGRGETLRVGRGIIE